MYVCALDSTCTHAICVLSLKGCISLDEKRNNLCIALIRCNVQRSTAQKIIPVPREDYREEEKGYSSLIPAEDYRDGICSMHSPEWLGIAVTVCYNISHYYSYLTCTTQACVHKHSNELYFLASTTFEPTFMPEGILIDVLH